MYPIKKSISKHQNGQDIEANKNMQQKLNGFLVKSSLKCVWMNFSHRAIMPSAIEQLFHLIIHTDCATKFSLQITSPI